MHKAEGLGMQGLTRQKLEAVLYELTILCIDGSLADLRTVVTLVIEERMADPVEMYTDLMGSSCLQTTFHNRDISESLQNLIMGNGMLAVISVRKDLEPHTIVRVAADVADDGTLILLEVTPDDSDIATLYRVHEELLCKVQLGLIILCNHKKSRSILVDAVHEHSHSFILSIRTLRYT